MESRILGSRDRSEVDANGNPDGLPRGALDQVDVVLGEPVADVLGGREHLKDPVVEARGANAVEPHRERALGEFTLGALDHVSPGALGGLFERCHGHSYPQSLSTYVETLGKDQRRPVGTAGAPGEARRNIAPCFSPRLARARLLTDFLAARPRRSRPTSLGILCRGRPRGRLSLLPRGAPG